MGDILAGVSSAIQAVKGFRDNLQGDISKATGIPLGGNSGGVRPIVDVPQSQIVGDMAPPPDFSGQGASAAAPQGLAMLMGGDSPTSEMAQSIMPQMQEEQERERNPYAGEFDQPIEEQITEPDAVVEGDTWRPEKAGWLGQVMDTLLMLRGRRPAFQMRKDQNVNLPEAMQGFQSDPEQAIRRVSRFNPQLATELQNKIASTQAAEALEAQRNAARQQIGDKVMGGMLTSIQDSPDPAGTYKRVLPTLRRYAEEYGHDPSLLGDEYDADSISAIRGAGMTAYEQERLSDADVRLDQQERNTQSQINYRSERLEQLGADTASKISNRNLRTQNMIRRSRQAGPSGQKYDVMDIRASNGEIRRVVLDRKSGTAYSKTPDGDTITYIIQGKELVPTGVVSKKKK